MIWLFSEEGDKFVLSASGARFELATSGDFVLSQEKNSITCWAGDPMFGFYALYRHPDGYKIFISSASGEMFQALPISTGRQLWEKLEAKEGLIRG